MKEILRKVDWRLRVLVADRGVRSARELADLLKSEVGYRIDSSQLTRYLKDTPPALTLDFLTAMATVLDADVTELFRIREVPHEPPIESTEPPPEPQHRRKRIKGGDEGGKPAKQESSGKVAGPKVVLFPGDKDG